MTATPMLTVEWHQK